MMKTKKYNKLFYVLVIFLILVFFSVVVSLLWNNDKNQNDISEVEELKEYKSFVLRLEDPSVTNGAEVITKAIMKVAKECNCLDAGYPWVEQADGEHYLSIAKRINLTNSECGFVTIPGAPSPVSPIIYIHVLPDGVKGITSKIEQDETTGFFIRYGSMGKLCGNYLDQNDQSYAQTQVIVLTALQSIGARGYEKFD